MPTSPVYNGTMTLLPASGAKIFRNQIVHCVVTYTASVDDENLPPNAIDVQINMSGGVAPDSDTLPKKGGDWALALQKVSGSEPAQYQGDFYAFAPTTGRGGECGFDIVLNGYTGDDRAQWDLQRSAANVSCSLDAAAIPVNLTDDAKADEPVVSKVVMKAAVTDAAGAPVPDYVVFWSSDMDPDTFQRVNAFVDEARQHTAVPVTSDVAPGSPVIRGVTDSHGVARLTLAPKKKALCLGIRCFAQATSPVAMDLVAVYDATSPDFRYKEPRIDLADKDGKYDLDSIQASFVPLSIAADVFEKGQAYDLFVFMNGRNVQYQTLLFPQDEVEPVDLQALLAKALFRSDSTDEGGKERQNTVYYVVNSQQAGCVTSLHTAALQCVGEPGEFKPDKTIEPRDLPRPVVEDAGPVVNANTIQNDLHLQIPVGKAGGWTPQVGDTLVSTIYLSGWSLWTEMFAGNVLSQKKLLVEADLDAAQTVMTYARATLYGYGPDPRSPQNQGAFYAEYYVVRDGEHDVKQNRIYSDYVTLERFSNV
ncbi:hypothetical protein ACFONL_16550 [Camelimonas fluminis]|uniref:Big-1 domain-containing protein n=1 Tax=Camelimonas fluminis TaxID=1576911 RepID=A0ABV7UKE9_9HYPH|nr:hypothetical protein [Camelimonas fluminis]